MESRGIRNNNPLNIRLTKERWKGQVDNPAERQFVTFSTMEYGIRAAVLTLRTYFRVHHLHTIHDIISRWAPPSENDTAAYIRTVCRLTGFGEHEKLTFCQDTVNRLVKAMAWVESEAELN